MALKDKEQAVVELVINGDQAKTSLREVTGSVNALRAELSSMRKEDNPALYDEKIQKLQLMREAQSEMRAEIARTREESKGFFSDWQKGFEEIERLVAGVTLGTLISSFVRGAIEKVEELWQSAEENYKKHEEAETLLANKIRATGDVSGETKSKLEKYQESLMKQTGIDEDVVAKGEDVLLTYTNIRGKIYDQALPAVLDYTAAMHNGAVTMEGVQESAGILGKALDNVSNAKRSLRAMGITLSAQEQKEIDTHRRNNDVMGAQQIIIDAVNKRYGGLMNTLSESNIGVLQRWSTSWEEVSKKIGGLIESGKAAIAEWLQPLVTSLGDTNDSVKKLSESYYDQVDKVKNLQEKTAPLLDRYDQLKEKASLNKTEQGELKTVIGQIADAIPSAITAWDKYGNAIGINTDKAREFIKMQQAVMKIQNKKAIEDTEDLIEDLAAKQKRLQDMLAYGKKVVATSAGAMDDTRVGGPKLQDLSDDEIKKAAKEVGDLQRQIDEAKLGIQGLRGENLDIPKPNDPKVVAPTGGLTDAEQKKADEEQKKRDEAKAKAKKELEEYQKQLQELHLQVDELISKSTKGTEAGLDGQLKVIDDKYNQIIDKIKKIDTSKFATTGDHKQNKSDIDAATAAKVNDEANLAVDTGYKEQLEKLKQFIEKKQALLDKQAAKSDITEEQYVKQSEELQKEDLEKQLKLEVQFGQSTIDTEKKLHDLEIKEAQRLTNEKKKSKQEELDFEKRVAEEKKKITEAEINLEQSGFAVVEAIFGKSKGLELAQLAFEKMLAVDKIEANTQVAISGITAKYAGIPFGEIPMAIEIAQVEAASNIEIAAVIAGGVAQAIGDLSGGSSKGGSSKKMADGGIIDGPSHAAGGVPLINGHTGEHVAELEGGESMAVFSRNTSANNRATINQLLFNSMHRNGARVDVDRIANPANQYAGFTHQAFPQAPASPSGSSAGNSRKQAPPVDMTETNQLLRGMHDKFDAFSKKPWSFDHKAFEDYTNTVADSRNAANAK